MKSQQRKVTGCSSICRRCLASLDTCALHEVRSMTVSRSKEKEKEAVSKVFIHEFHELTQIILF